MRFIACFAIWSAATVACADDPVERGHELFTREWKPQTPSERQGDGLGPYFNARSCAECHKLGGVGGAGPSENNVQLINTQLVDIGDHEDPEASRRILFPGAVNGVLVLHRHSFVPGYEELRKLRLLIAGAQAPVRIRIQSREALVGPRICGSFCGVRSPPPRTLEERNTPALFGAGLIDRVTPSDLEAISAKQADDVRGRPARLPNGDVGRFGWKGQIASLQEFCEQACVVELGLETPGKKDPTKPFERRAPNNPTYDRRTAIVPDMTADQVGDLTQFVAALPAPMKRVSDEVVDGELLFHSIGCAECHTPDIGVAKGIYSDLLLHRIGTTGQSFYGEPQVRSDGDLVLARPDEFRTPPLWGVADSAPFLHDGSAPDLDAAIHRHNVQARRSQTNYLYLDAEGKRRLLAFLESLRAPPTN